MLTGPVALLKYLRCDVFEPGPEFLCSYNSGVAPCAVPSRPCASSRTEFWYMTRASFLLGRLRWTLLFILLPLDVTVHRSKTYQPGSSGLSHELAVVAPLAIELSVVCVNQADAAPKT